MGIGDWGLGIGDWGLGPNPQSPIPNPHLIFNLFINLVLFVLFNFINYLLMIKLFYFLACNSFSCFFSLWRALKPFSGFLE